MSYQPPFDGNWLGQHQGWAAYDKPPPSVRAAVMFIYAGAAIQELWVVLNIAAIRDRVQLALGTAPTMTLTASQEHMTEGVGGGFLIFGTIVGATLWLWMARKNKAGRRWARTLSTVFFAFLTVGMLGVIAQPVGVAGKIVPVAEWLVGIVAIALLWQRDSSGFFVARSRRY
jgi:hypothetical protein